MISFSFTYFVIFCNIWTTDTNEDRWIMGDFYSHFCNLSVLACCHFLHPAAAPLVVNGVPVLLKLMKYPHN